MAEVKEGADIVDQALLLNPNLARSWNLSGWVRIFLGQPDLAIEHLERAMRLSPLDFAFHAMEAATAHAHLAAGRYHEAMVWAEKAVRDQPNQGDALVALSIASARAGNLDKARAAMKRLLQVRPHRRISNFFLPRVTPENRAPVEDILRKLGMPE
jgi:tetratricopeptide (TPR) repeat protein